jgi:hypothetical protein
MNGSWDGFPIRPRKAGRIGSPPYEVVESQAGNE